MGPYEESIRDTLSNIATKDILKDAVEKILESHCNIYALWAMANMMMTQAEADKAANARQTPKFQYLQGRESAFREIFEKVAFDGLSVADGTLRQAQLNEAISFWKERVEKVITRS